MYAKDNKMFDFEDEKTNDSDSDVSNSDESGPSPPTEEHKETIDKKSFKNKVFAHFKK